MTADLCPLRRIGPMAVIAIAKVDPQRMVHWTIPLVRVFALRTDNIVVRLTDFPKGRLARTQLGS